MRLWSASVCLVLALTALADAESPQPLGPDFPKLDSDAVGQRNASINVRL